MKRILSLLLLAGVVLASCNKYDDSELRSKISDQEKRIVALEEKCNQMNTNITSLQTLLDAINGNDYVKSVTPVNQGGVVVGFTITFTKSDPITIYHGKDGATPQIGVRQHTDGKYYWTINGEWLLDSNNNKVPATGEKGETGWTGQTPELKIEDGFWYVSIGGNPWQKLGKATGEDGQNGDSMFESVEVNEDNNTVTFTLSDGSTFTLPYGELPPISFDDDDEFPFADYNSVLAVNLNIDAERISKVFVTYDGFEKDDILTRASDTGWKTSKISFSQDNKQILIEIRSGDTPEAITNITIVFDNGHQYTISKIVSNTHYVDRKGISNCYIIPPRISDCFLDAKRPKSNARGWDWVPNSMVSAEVLWQYCPGYDRTLIEDVDYDSEKRRIYFFCDGEGITGNAVIAAKDAEGNILYTWHIWITDQPKDQVYKDGTIVMDRNLGAGSATPGDVASLGLLYQWGRKNPFLGSSSLTENTQAVSSTPVVWSVDYYHDFDIKEISSPTSFLYYLTLPKNQIGNWDAPDKNYHDPCPNGYRVMTTKFANYRDKVTFDYDNLGINFNSSNILPITASSDDCWYPAAGYLKEKGLLTGVGDYVAFHSANTDYFYSISSQSNVVRNQFQLGSNFESNTHRAASVRCMKE